MGHDRRGTVFAEFLIAYPVVFLMFLGIMQLSLLSVAALVVRHAAYRAARTAAVVIDADPERYGDAPRMILDLGSDGQRDGGAGIGALLQGGAKGERRPEGSRDVGPRMKVITRAAQWSLGALAPSKGTLEAWLSGQAPAVRQGALHGGGAGRAAVAFAYTPLSTLVTFDGKAKQGRLRFTDGEILRVRVKYAYACSVPIAQSLTCDSLFEVQTRPVVSGLVEWLSGGFGLEAARVYRLSATASFPLHGAAYLYRSEHASNE